MFFIRFSGFGLLTQIIKIIKISYLFASVHNDELVIASSLRDELNQINFLLLGDPLDIQRQLSSQWRRHRHVQLCKSGFSSLHPEADGFIDQVDPVPLDADNLDTS